jgi:hypothetical protein
MPVHTKREVIFMLFHKSKSKEEKEPDISKMASVLPNMNKSNIPADVLGSYTGTDEDGDQPTQDADDL